MSGINVAKLTEEIQAAEGYSPDIYYLNGIPHIGYGHNIKANPLDGFIDFYLSEHGCITDEMGSYLFDRDFSEAADFAQHVTPVNVWRGLSPNRREVIIEMIFNMGLKSYLGFTRMMEAMIDGNHTRVVAEMEDSNWYRNPLTTKRAKKLAWKWLEG